MTYQLPPEIDQRVQSQLALGIYSTPAEVLADALDALDALDERNQDLASIQRGIDDELAGRITPLREFDEQLRAQFGITSHE
jgi:predicted transcriptional regulator